MKYILKQPSIDTTELENFLESFLKGYQYLNDELSKLVIQKDQNNILSTDFSDTDLFEINKLLLSNLEEKRSLILSKDIQKDITNGISKLKEYINLYEKSTEKREEISEIINKFQKELKDQLTEELNEISKVVKEIKDLNRLIKKNFKSFRDPSDFDYLKVKTFKNIIIGELIYFQYYRKANPNLNLNIGRDLNTKKDYYLAKIENLDKDGKKPIKFKIPELNIQSIFKIIDKINDTKLILKRIVLTDIGYKNTTEEIEITLDENNQYFGKYLYFDSKSKLSQIKETIPFEKILKSLSNFAKNKENYQLNSEKDNLGRYINKERSYALYSTIEHSINKIIKDYDTYELIERVKINDFTAKYRKFVQDTLKNNKINDLDYYNFLLVYKESAFHLNYIYEILNKLKESGLNEIEFLSNGKNTESELIIKDTSFFIIYAQAFGFDNRYRYIEWKTNKDVSNRMEKASEQYNKKFMKEKEEKFDIKKEKSKLGEIEVIKVLNVEKDVKPIILELKEKKSEITITYLKPIFMVMQLFNGTGTIRDKKFTTKDETLQYLIQKKVSQENLELFNKKYQ